METSERVDASKVFFENGSCLEVGGSHWITGAVRMLLQSVVAVLHS